MESMTIGKVARLSEVGVETVRFYERQGRGPRDPLTAAGLGQSI